VRLGANYIEERRCEFVVWAPFLGNVELAMISPERKVIPMIKDGRGYWSAVCADVPAGSRYAYRLEGKTDRPDPTSHFQPDGVHGPSEVFDVRSFVWNDRQWKGIPLDEMIIYELHVGTFTADGTFEAMIPFLGYLRDELGVTAVELMPVAQFPGKRNWGYDGTYLFAPHNTYGGPPGLKRLVEACHQKGLAVILDVVYNHLGPEGNYLREFGPYSSDKYKTWWGDAINFDGPESDEVRRFFIENALYWIEDYHIDGLRLDAVHGIFDFSARHILLEIRDEVHRKAGQLGRSVVVIAESDLNDSRVIDPPELGGFGMDAQWSDDFHHTLHTLITGERQGYYRDFGDIRQMAKAFRDGFVFTGQYSSHRRRRHGNSSDHLSPEKFVVFSQDHDQVGNRPFGVRLTVLVPFEALKVAAAAVLLAANIPLLFMGEEYGEEAPFSYFIDHSDPDLVEAIRKGRKEGFGPFQWDREFEDPADESTFLRAKLRIEKHTEGYHSRLFAFYGRLIQLRKQIPAFSHLTKDGLKAEVPSGTRVIFLERAFQKDQVICLFNFDSSSAEIKLSPHEGRWGRILDGSSEEWGGPGGSLPEFVNLGQPNPMPLNGYGVAVYRRLFGA
jgi:maltooligosyltrehalose trehalohydrolase